MNGTLHSYFKVGIVNFMAFPAPYPVYEATAKIAGDAFFGAIEVTRIADPGERTRVANLLAASHMVVGYGAQPVQLGGKLDLNSLDDDKRMVAVRTIKACVDEAYELGATRLAVLSGPDPGAERRAEGMAALVRSLDEICAYAAGKGQLGITLEVFDRDIDKKALIGSTSDAVLVAKELRKSHPSFGLMIDLSHLPLQGESSQDALLTAKDYLVHIHVGNCSLVPGHPAYGDLHPRFGIAGGANDTAELREFLRVLFEIDYLGEGKQNIVAFEVKPQSSDEAPEVVIANAKRTLLAAWAGV
ncbi:MAG: sugar phosphate isomerase/epimerase family protein [Chloroflexota bacterium]